MTKSRSFDLNPTIAAVAETPEKLEFNSARYRIRTKQARRRSRGVQQEEKRKNRPNRERSVPATDVNADRWLAPITDRPLPEHLKHGRQGRRIYDDPGLPIPFEQYQQLLDWTGRQLRRDRRGAIPVDLAGGLGLLPGDTEHGGQQTLIEIVLTLSSDMAWSLGRGWLV